jgi:hypothetical protein
LIYLAATKKLLKYLVYKADDITPSLTFNNRLRNGGDQIFPLWWALLLQSASGTHYVTDAIARQSGGVFVPLVEVEDIDNADINQRLMETIEWISEHSQYVRIATADGVIDADERERLKRTVTGNGEVAGAFNASVSGFCALKRVTPASVQLLASWRIAIVWRTNA